MAEQLDAVQRYLLDPKKVMGAPLSSPIVAPPPSSPIIGLPSPSPAAPAAPDVAEGNSWQKPATIAGVGAGAAGLGYAARNLSHLANPLGALPPQTPAAPGLLARAGNAVLRGGANLLAKPLGLLAKHPVTTAIVGGLYPNNNIATDAQEQEYMKQAASYGLPAGYESATPEEKGQMLADPNYVAKAREQAAAEPAPAPAATTDPNNPASDFVRTITPSATDSNREMFAAADGKGNYLTGMRPRGTGGGSFSVIGRGAEGVSPEEWEKMSQQERTSLRVRDLQNERAALQRLNATKQEAAYARGGYSPRVASGGGGTSWGEALKDYAAGRVGTTGYGMVSNFVGKTTQDFNGREVPNIDGLARMNAVKQMAAEEMKQSGEQKATDPLDAQRFLLDQSKFGYQQAKDDRELALQEEEFSNTRRTANDARRKDFMSNYSYPDKNAPQGELGALVWSLSEATGLPPEIMGSYVQKAATQGKVNWKNAPPQSLVELGKQATALAAKEYGG